MTQRLVRLEQVVDINPSTKSTGSPNDLVAFLAMADISEEGRVVSVQQRPLADVQKGYTVFQTGDVLLAKITPCFENGKAALVESLPTQIGFGSTEFHVLRATEEIDPKFLFHLVWNQNFRRLGASRMTGSAGQKRVPVALLADYEFSLPSLHEQQRIATILDKADGLRRKRQTAIRIADTLRRAVFVQMYGDPVLNPKAWPVLAMGDVIEFKGGSQPPKETFTSAPRPGYVRLVQIRDFKSDKYKTYIPEELAKRSFGEDDVMVARYGPPVFQILRGLSGSYNVALMKAQPRPNVLKEFVFWLLQLPRYQSAVISSSERTAGQTGVNLAFLNALDVPLPPLEIQEEIATTMVKMSLTVGKQQAMLEESEKLFASLQSQYFESRELV